MSRLIPIEAIYNFQDIKEITDAEITTELITAVKELDEREEIEPFLRIILSDFCQTPHGPAELVDIFTHKVTVRGRSGMAAFIIKGKSFETVRPADVSHQIYRLKKIDGLSLAVFAAAGTILDAAKEQFCATCEESGYGYSIFGANELARLFIAYGFLCPRDGRIISSGRCQCGYSPHKKRLNFLQNEALAELEATHRLKRKTGLIVLPPGSGKTRIAVEDAKRTNANKILFLAHTHEILDGAEIEFLAKFKSESVSRPDSGADLDSLRTVTIASIQLFYENIDRFNEGEFDYVIVDEFHHAAASSYRCVLEKLRPSFTLGLTATPYREDRQSVIDFFDNIILVQHELRFGIETGILSPYHYYACYDDVDYSKIQHNGVCYSIHDLERALIIPKRDIAIIKKWEQKAAKLPTLAFCCTIKHAKRVANNFRQEGITADVYSSEMTRFEREQTLTKFKTRKTTVLCVIDILNEGADLPMVECLLFLRPTESRRIFYQQLGRGLRRYPGKKFCIVIDFIGHFRNAHRVLEYQGLLPFNNDSSLNYFALRQPKDVLNIPNGCEVHFDERVIDIIATSANSLDNISRYTIERILLFQFDHLAKKLGRHPTKQEIDRNFTIGSPIYTQRWGSWKAFEAVVTNRPILS